MEGLGAEFKASVKTSLVSLANINQFNLFQGLIKLFENTNEGTSISRHNNILAAEGSTDLQDFSVKRDIGHHLKLKWMNLSK